MNEEMEFPETFEQFIKEYGFKDNEEVYTNGSDLIQIFRVKQWLEHQMTAEEYRQRMIQAFHNADCGELIAICVLPTEKEFEHLEWLLKNHYKKEPCDDAISRQAVMDCYKKWQPYMATRLWDFEQELSALPPVTPQQKTGQWQQDLDGTYLCSECGSGFKEQPTLMGKPMFAWCPLCGAKMQEVDI